MPVTVKRRAWAFQSAPHAESERGLGKTLNIPFDYISSCILSHRDFAFNRMCCTQALCSLTNISPLATSQPTGGLVLNPSQQIQLRDPPRTGRGSGIATKGIIDSIKLSVYSRKGILYHQLMYAFHNPARVFVGSNLVATVMMIVTLHLESRLGRFY